MVGGPEGGEPQRVVENDEVDASISEQTGQTDAGIGPEAPAD